MKRELPMSYFPTFIPCLNSFQLVRSQEEGQSVVEYILLVAVIIAIVMGLLTLYTGSLNQLYQLINITFEQTAGNYSL